MELDELKYQLIEGSFDDSTNSQCLPVWLEVDFPEELLNFVNEYKTTENFIYDKKTGKPILIHGAKPSVWTAFDDYIYNKYPKNERVPREEIPQISAVFKSCFNKYSAVVENMAMKIAIMLDMPTSYNYIVKFTPEKHPEITSSYPTPEKAQKAYPYGVVSIDFLQNKQGIETISTTEYVERDEEGNIIATHEIDSIDTLSGDELIQFDDALQKYNIATNSLTNDQNLIKNWIKVVDELARRELEGSPQETINKSISNIHSRIARSFLLKDLVLGDCDFTPRNAGMVINRINKKLRYAPNYDYGEALNSLVKRILEKQNSNDYCGMSKEVFESQQPFVQERLRQIYKNKKTEFTIKEVAEMSASAESEENLQYVFEHFPSACREFFENLDELIRGTFIDTLVDSYNDMTVNGVPLLTKEECNMIKEYIRYRIAYAMQKYADYLTSHNMEIPELSY